MINICKLELTNLQQEILRLLFVKAGSSLNQRAVAKALGVTPPAVMRAVPGLEEAGMAKVEQDGESKRWSISLNRESRRAVQLKRVDNLRQVYESGLADFLEKEFAGGTVILFGSYSFGDDTCTSDIDIAIVGRKKKDVALDEYGEALGRMINLNFYESLKDVHKDLRENLCNGILLAGSVEL